MRAARAALLALAGMGLLVGLAHAGDGGLGRGWSEAGRASFYSQYWHGRRTASGERFDNGALTAAHAWLPFGTRIRVQAEESGREVVVTITDRMVNGRRVIDLSQHAARVLGIVRQGTADVVLQPD